MALKRATPPKRVLEHLLFAGHNPLSPPLSISARTRQTPSNPSLVPSPFHEWLGAVGRAEDVASGYRIVPGGLGSGLHHNVVAYEAGGTTRCLAVGRNEAAQLGLGWNSQEPTRGLVEGFTGDAILATKASAQSSYLVLSEGDDRTSLYVFGSLERGRLGLPGFAPPDRDDQNERDLAYLSQATKVQLPEGFGEIKQIAVGFEHLLLLSNKGEIWGSGCCTDGQLGLGESNDIYELTKLDLPAGVSGVASIHAGADTSAFLSDEGQLYSWGNSEYGQAGHGAKIDQILTPKLVDLGFLPSPRRIVDFRCGGSFTVLLDDQGSVYSVGFGALGVGKGNLESLAVSPIPGLEEGVTRIRAGWGYAAAIKDTDSASSIYTWGVNNAHGRLGIGATLSSGSKLTIPGHAYIPTRVSLPIKELSLAFREEGSEGSEWNIGEVECGEGTLWVSLVEQVDE